MSTHLIPFSQSADLPAHINAFMEGEQSNIGPKDTIPQLSFRGKVWRTVIEGEETQILDGEGNPRPVVKLIILNQNKDRSRSYYEGAFEEGKSQRPACWSGDGKTPDADVPEPKSKSCATCPMSVKGSKITPNGKEVSACSQYKRLVVVPSNNLDATPMLLRLPQTSMWDKDNAQEAQGWYAYDQYMDMLRARGCNHTALVVTKAKFDANTAYPKLLFAAEGWLPPDALLTLKEKWNGDEVKALLKASDGAAADRAPAAVPAVAAPAPAAPAPAPTAPKATKPKAAAPAPTPPAPPAPTPAAAPAPTGIAGFGEDDEAPAAAPQAPAAPAATVAPAAGNKALGSLLNDWDD